MKAKLHINLKVKPEKIIECAQYLLEDKKHNININKKTFSDKYKCIITYYINDCEYKLKIINDSDLCELYYKGNFNQYLNNTGIIRISHSIITFGDMYIGNICSYNMCFYE